MIISSTRKELPARITIIRPLFLSNSLVKISCQVYNVNTKRKELIQYLMKKGASLAREGSRHSIYQKGNNRTAIPRHIEIVDELAKKICNDLEIPFKKGENK